ncbi:MAG: hypothetical protein LBG88_00145 [Christensenellaceae bacterium]|jgi:hypothetical protein|nr:hypothetical protein [Christensenellaceae bacterium]
MFKKRKVREDVTYTDAVNKIESGRLRTRFSTRVFFWMFILLMILSLFMFWFNRGKNVSAANLIVGIAAACMSVFFGLLCFVRFIRSRSITGGLFLSTAISTGVFLGVSQLIPIFVPPTAAAFTASPDLTNNGFQLLVALSQIGLFAVWFAFLLFTIYLYVKPVRRIDKYLGKIIDGEEIKKVSIGHARQYKAIEEKIETIAVKKPKNAS